MKQTLVVIIVAAALTMMLSALIIVSIVWTHRPDLSSVDIMVLAVREIGDIIILKAGGHLRRKGKCRK